MVTHSKIIKTLPKNLRLDILPKSTKGAFLLSVNFNFLPCKKWYLAGGTALALQVGHRQSVDLDFFTSAPEFNETELERELTKIKGWSTTLREKGTIYGTLAGAKISFIAYPFFKPSTKKNKCGKICIIYPDDIAAMKIAAISQRGRKRDFVDLYWYCVNMRPLKDVVQHALHKYPGQEHNLPHFLKSLVYFDDAESDPMPRLFFKANWKTIKAYFCNEVKSIANEMINV